MKDSVIIIDKKCKLTYENNNLVINIESEEQTINFELISTIIIENTSTELSSYLLSELAKNNIDLMICDSRKFPIAKINSFIGTNDSLKKINTQILWSEKSKGIVWQRIVRDKTNMQYKTAIKNNLFITAPDEIKEYDSTNTEGRYAFRYFKVLFGYKFTREIECDVNFALNYGYTILSSLVSRIITSHGFLNQVGIFHKGSTNTINFACDIMEPFRPIIDNIVYQNKDFKFDKEYKRKLINIHFEKIMYNDKVYTLPDAIENYFLDVVKSLTNGEVKIKELKIL